MLLRRRATQAFCAVLRDCQHTYSRVSPSQRRHASTESTNTTSDALAELEPSSSLTTGRPSPEIIESFDPAERARQRTKQLPSSRYQFRPPKYYRGPLHPHQPPPPSDPSSREFVPGPFSLPRLEQTYQSTIAPDFMTLAYAHYPPGERPGPAGPRLRSWDDSSPYHKNRPLRGPRGGDHLRLLKKPITFRHIPRAERVTVHTMVKKALTDSAHLHAAGMVLQAITNVRAIACKSKGADASFGLRAHRYVAVKVDLRGEDMYHFLSRCVDLVLPRVKDWQGIKGSAGDSSGNISFGLPPDAVKLFPEIEVNYDMYPPDMIPGVHITIHTSATQDKEARLLLGALGFPFFGKLVD